MYKLLPILLFAFSLTQDYPVEMSVEDVDTDAGTLNIKMKNVDGCYYCTDPQYVCILLI